MMQLSPAGRNYFVLRGRITGSDPSVQSELLISLTGVRRDQHKRICKPYSQNYLFTIPRQEGLCVDLNGLGGDLLTNDLKPLFAGKVHVPGREAEYDVVKDAGVPEL